MLLNVLLFKPLQVYYDQAVKKWLRKRSGRTVTQFQVAYERAVSIANATHRFRKCGVWPVEMFTQDDLQTQLTVVVEKGDENNCPEDENDILFMLQ